MFYCTYRSQMDTTIYSLFIFDIQICIYNTMGNKNYHNDCKAVPVDPWASGPSAQARLPFGGYQSNLHAPQQPHVEGSRWATKNRQRYSLTVAPLMQQAEAMMMWDPCKIGDSGGADCGCCFRGWSFPPYLKPTLLIGQSTCHQTASWCEIYFILLTLWIWIDLYKKNKQINMF